MKITTWSPSRLFKYEECPRKAKYAYVDKLPEPGPKNPALVKGEEYHSNLEFAVKGSTPLIPELTKMQPLVTQLNELYKAGKCRVELSLAVRRNWTITSWFAKDAWGRFKLDILVFEDNKGRVLDWKTGKFKPDGDYADQLNSYSTATLSAFPQLTEMTSALVFAEHSVTPVERPEGTVHRDNLTTQQTYWTERVARMENDTVFAPRPSPFACKWCPYSRNVGGPCEF